MSVQNHIHLSTSLGAAPENAPSIKWKVAQQGWAQTVQTFVTVKYGLTGALHEQVLLDDSALPVKKEDQRLRLLVRDYDGMTVEDRVAALKAMVNRRVYFTNIDHAANGANHASDVRTMFFAQMGPIPDDHPTLEFFLIDIELLDAS